MPETTPVGIVDTRLAAEGHAHLEDSLVAVGDPRRLVPFESDAVAGAMFEEWFKAGLANLVEALLVYLLGDGSLFHVSGARVVCGQHRLIQLLGVIAGRPN